jgi:hypothetical protein
MAISREDISLLHNHDESLSEEQLRREIEHLNAELGKFKVREYRRSISPVPMPVHQFAFPLNKVWRYQTS